HYHARGADGRAQGVPRGGRGGRGGIVGTLLARDAASHQARARRGHPLLYHLHVRRLQHRPGAHARRPSQHHAPLCDAGLSGGALGWQPRAGRGHLALHLPAAGLRRVLPAALHQEGIAVAVRSRGARIRSNVFAYATLAPYVLFVLLPFYFMIVTSFKSNAELYNLKSIPFWIQSGIILDHYALLFQKTDFLTWMKNSLLVAVVATTISVIISILPRYSLARLRFRGGAVFRPAIFITYPIPPPLLFLPLSQVVVWLGLADSITSLMVTYPTFLVPFCTWLLMGYFRTIPREVEECALVDGATRLQTLGKIVLPMAIPGVICA